jgi:hypothetical protein
LTRDRPDRGPVAWARFGASAVTRSGRDGALLEARCPTQHGRPYHYRRAHRRAILRRAASFAEQYEREVQADGGARGGDHNAFQDHVHFSSSSSCFVTPCSKRRSWTCRWPGAGRASRPRATCHRLALSLLQERSQTPWPTCEGLRPDEVEAWGEM